MQGRDVNSAIAVVVSVLLIGIPSLGYPSEQPETAGGTDSAPLSAHELRALVAPIALYPDPLVAQVLAAATFPDQVAVANYWVGQNKSLSGKALMQAVNRQSWDASVKSLTQFPSVLGNMANNLNWTSSLGEAYHNQRPAVMEAIQTLRAQAKAAGNLKSSSQIAVNQQSPDVITIEPANPQVVYVPQYDPALIYGVPYVTPAYTAGDVALGSMLGFGAGVAVGALGSGGCCGWGSWNANWSGGSVTYNHNNFYGNAAWHGGYYNGAYHNGYGYQNAYDKNAIENKGYANRAENLDRNQDLNRAMSRYGNERAPSSNSWAHADNAFRSSNALSGFDRSAHGGWESRADSFRGWGSMHAGGFFGGRFGGGGFGRAHFGGGGFHRR